MHIRDSKSGKQKVHWTLFNEKLFLDLMFEEKQKGAAQGKAFKAMGWENS